MTNQNDFNQEIMQPGKKPRAQNRLPQASYIQADQWMHYLGYEQYCWWMKFHTWVNREPNRLFEQHIPYTLESVFKKLGVSQTTFYRKIKILWECGLIDFIEFGERKTQKPKNIIVYEYPFNNAVYEYLPLEKRRDWVKDYASESVLAGIRGGIKKKEMNPPNSERVEESTFSPVDNSPVSVDNLVENSPVDNVDNSEIDPPNSERVDPPKSERVTLPDLGANNCTNNITNISNKLINISNNSLSKTKIDLIHETLKIFDFKEGERERIIELIIHKGLFSVTKKDIIEQAKFMSTRPNIRNRSLYFVTGLEMNEGRAYSLKATTTTKQEAVTTPLPFYNWLEQ
jgi:hypothetical protein